jgi:hypothetical protein
MHVESVGGKGIDFSSNKPYGCSYEVVLIAK